jgi:predicted adenylyl cyclase CyaB
LAKNIEIKAVLREPDLAEEKVKHFTGKINDILNQVDTFYKSPRGRIKIREINNIAAELIFYKRENSTKARESKYYKFNLFFPKLVKAILKITLGEMGRVEKVRRLYLYNNTRIHLDHVSRLGSFIEFEYVVDASHPEVKGYDVINELMALLGIKENDLLSVSYIDMTIGL